MNQHQTRVTDKQNTMNDAAPITLYQHALKIFFWFERTVKQQLHVGFIIFSLMLLWGCQGYVKPDFERLSESMQATSITTPYHQHLVLTRLSPNSPGSLHVYIEGDGRPWIKRYLVAKDPTPRSPMTLALMRQDRGSAVFLGRPCYFNDPSFGLDDKTCEARHWTSARYSETVVTSMVDALRQLLAEQNYSELTLIGYSGGGTIATLMAQRMPEVTQLVTIAANLDVDAWTRHHHYSALTESLNPAESTATQPARQYHFAGSKDRVVPPALTQNWLRTQGQSLRIIDGFDHQCCWPQKWQELLRLINSM